jgi:hypothetical protein
MSRVYEVEQELAKARSELQRLESHYDYYTTSSYDLTQGEGRTDHHTGQTGTKEEIAQARNRVKELERKLKEAIEWEKDAPRREAEAKKDAEARKTREEEKKQREKENKEMDKREAERVFRKIKEQYKKLGGWDKLINRVNGKTPNWKKVRELPLEELEFLLAVGTGRTIEQEKYAQEHIISSRDKKAQKSRRERNIEKMRQMMKLNYKLKDAMKREEQQKHGHSYRGY